MASVKLGSKNSDCGVIQAKDVLLSLKALCTGTLEMNDTDFELLENHLKDLNSSGQFGIVFGREQYVSISYVKHSI